LALYFAYGSCMSEESLNQTVEARLIGPGKLKDYCLTFNKFSKKWGGGVADIIPAPGGLVEGVLFEVKDFVELDRREGAPNYYRRIEIEVETEIKGCVQVVSYEVVKKSPELIIPTNKYMNMILEGAQILSLNYQAFLRSKFSSYLNSPFEFKAEILKDSQRLYESENPATIIRDLENRIIKEICSFVQNKKRHGLVDESILTEEFIREIKLYFNLSLTNNGTDKMVEDSIKLALDSY